LVLAKQDLLTQLFHRKYKGFHLLNKAQLLHLLDKHLYSVYKYRKSLVLPLFHNLIFVSSLVYFLGVDFNGQGFPIAKPAVKIFWLTLANNKKY